MHNLLLNICIPPSFCCPLRLGLKTNCSKLVSTLLCKTLFFMCWHDAERSNISVFLFFSGSGVDEDLCFSFMELSSCQGSASFKGIICCTPTVDCLCRVFRKKSVDEISSYLIYPSQLFHVNEEMEVFVSHQSCEINARLAA